MATNNSVNTPLSGTTGTGNFVGSLSPSLTNPNMNAIYSAGDLQIVFGNAASPVNFLQITNGATANPVQISANGTDTDVALFLSAKGSSQIRLANDLLMYNPSGGNNYTNFTCTASGAKSVTIPSLSGTMAISGASQNVTFGTVQTSQINDTNANQIIGLTPIASAVNYLGIGNASTTNYPAMYAAGTDTNVGIVLEPKGTGEVLLNTKGASNQIRVLTNSGNNATFLSFGGTATRTVTFQDADGTVAYLSDITGANNTVQTVDTTNRSTTSTSYVSSSISVTITPSSNTSKVRISCFGVAGTSLAGGGFLSLTLYRGGVDLTPSGVNGMTEVVLTSSGFVATFAFDYIDSPATTSATTYTLYFKTASGTGYIGRRGVDTTVDAPTFITATEIRV